MKFPWIIRIEIEVRDDVRVARQESGFPVKEVDDKLFVGRVEPKPRWQVNVAVSHLSLKMQT